MITDNQLKQVDSKEFRRKTGITKTDYRFLRNTGINLENVSIFRQDDKPLNLHRFIGELRDIDVIYMTRRQVERR